MSRPFPSGTPFSFTTDIQGTTVYEVTPPVELQRFFVLIVEKLAVSKQMEGGVGEHETWEPLWSALCSLATSSAGSLQDELDERSPAAAAEHKVFVAVPEEVSDGRSTLLWALHNLVRDGSKVVIAHVHSPAAAITQSKFIG